MAHGVNASPLIAHKREPRAWTAAMHSIRTVWRYAAIPLIVRMIGARLSGVAHQAMFFAVLFTVSAIAHGLAV